MVNRFPGFIPTREAQVFKAPTGIARHNVGPGPLGEKLPFLFALQFAQEDRAQAMSLARLLADIEDKPRNDVGFMFCPRFDVFVDNLTEVMVREKFPDTKVYQCKNHITGWPKGPNAMVHEIFGMFSRKFSTPHSDWRYSAIMFGEPDCVPLSKDWITRLYDEWHNCDWDWPGGNHQLALGHWITKDDSECGVPHINGNMMISPRLMDVYPQFTSTSIGAWDTTHARTILNYARPSKMIFSDYGIGARDGRKPWVSCEDLWKTRYMKGANPIAGVPLNPVWLHGVKDIRAQDCVRERLVTKNDKPER